MKKLLLVLLLVIFTATAFNAAAVKKSTSTKKSTTPKTTANTKSPSKGNVQRPPMGPRPGGHGMMMGGNLEKELNLTAAQKKKVEALQNTYKTKFDAQRKAMFGQMPKGNPGKGNVQRPKPTQADMEKMRKNMETMRKLGENYENDFKKILTKTQLAKYDKMKKEQMERMKNFRPGGPMGPGSNQKPVPPKPAPKKK